MPVCGSQVYLCDLPIRFDTYKGCTHNCKYCFTYRKYDISKIETNESADSVRGFINGKRDKTSAWCDWNIPLHWGGLSDPFQPAERKYRQSYEVLKVLAETKYPVVVSTKGTLPAEPEYLELIKQCNMIFQVSLVSPQFDKVETGAATFKQRVEMIRKIAPHVNRVVIRAQPYVLEVFRDIMGNLKLYKETGVYGVVFEGMKFLKKIPGTIRVGGDFCYPRDRLLADFIMLKEECHRQGLKFYCGENRLRHMSDSLCCCGIDKDDTVFGDYPDTHPNTANMNHKLYDPENYVFTAAQCEIGTGIAFKAIHQIAGINKTIRLQESYKSLMELCSKDKKMMSALLSRD